MWYFDGPWGWTPGTETITLLTSSLFLGILIEYLFWSGRTSQKSPMKKKEIIDTAEWYRKYIRCGGIHSRDEFLRFSDNLMGILTARYGERFRENRKGVDFGDLITGDPVFTSWVDYTGSIKEAKIYLKSMLKVLGKGE